MSTLLANKIGHANFINNLHQSYAQLPNKCTAYDMAYSQSKRLDAKIYLVSEYVDGDGYAFHELKIQYKDGTSAVLSKNGFKVTQAHSSI